MVIQVIDNETNEPLAGANVFSSTESGMMDGSGIAAGADEDGYIDMPGNPVLFWTFSFVGYQKKTISAISMPSVIALDASDAYLPEVEIIADAPQTEQKDYTAYIVAGVIVASLIALYFAFK